MNDVSRTLVFRVGLIAFLVAILATIRRLRDDPALRAGFAWAVRSWITPPDADAGWQQNLSGRPAWRPDPRC